MALQERKTVEIGNVAAGSGILIDIIPEEEFIVLRIGKENVRVKKSEFWGVCYMMADAKTQDSLLPVRQTEMMTFERIHEVKLKKDMRKGEMLRYKAKIDVPITIVESLKGMVEEKKKSVFAVGGIPKIGG